MEMNPRELHVLQQCFSVSALKTVNVALIRSDGNHKSVAYYSVFLSAHNDVGAGFHHGFIAL